MTNRSTTPWGAWGAHRAGDTTAFSLWSPGATTVALELNDERLPMQRDDKGAWTASVACEVGSHYRYAITLPDGREITVADPASRAQDGDIDDASLVVSTDYAWQHDDWNGRPWHEAVFYELHPGALGGFAGVTEKLASLAALGITAVELMPVSDFPGARNWGYDGVLPFAPDAAYGTPHELKHLIDTAHGLGLMVFLDVVWNHFGPDGNYLHDYAPTFFRSGESNNWGGSIDFTQPEVRNFFTSNANHWLQDYRFDGLRIDAAHAISDQGWLVEMAASVKAATAPGRHVHLVLEHDDNASGLLTKGFAAQWNDDGHHVLHVLLSGETDGYYSDYAQQPAEALARCLAEGFIYQGQPSPHRDNAPRGEPSAALSPTSFVLFLQNHDQTGNRAFGERLTTLADPAALRAAQALQLLAPQIPLLFMGEESASTEPFFYFTSHRSEELATAVREGRAREFAASAAFGDESRRHEIPDPNDESTFTRSIPARIGEQGEAATVWVRDLLALRRQHLTPQLPNCRAIGAEALGPAAVMARWQLGPSVLTIVVNLAETALNKLPAHVMPNAKAHTLFDTGGVRHALATGMLRGHACLAWIESA